jgi:aminopeptidase N
MNKLIHIFILLTGLCFAQTAIYDTGGPLMPEQASYDVTFYDLHVNVSPKDSLISGFVEINAQIVQPIDYFVVDLDTLLQIDRIVEINKKTETEREYERKIGKIWIALRRTRQANETVEFKIAYHGKPRIAINPPWDGGFTWAKTKDGSPWIATSCQGEGADIWWPVKDHVSDKPDSMGIHIRVPDPLICASNGKLLQVEKHNDNTSTYHWFVSSPISAYNVALNIAPYKLIEEKYTSTCGDVFPFMFWVLPEDYENGLKIFSEFKKHLRFFEETLGPYPFRADKYGVVQTPHLGMEHQTIIAYGANFNNGSMTGGEDWGFDALHHHELSHEWWGNMVTNADWKDMWIHEGFGTYMQAWYVEYLQGMEAYHKYIASLRNFSEQYPIAPNHSMTEEQIYKAPIYSKGASVLNTLRYLIGDDAFKRTMRLMAYPNPELEKVTDGHQTRFVTSNDFITIAEQVSGKELEWFFEVYLRQAKLPKLKAQLRDNKLLLSWITPQDLPFPMPITVKIGDEEKRIEIPNNGTSLVLEPNVKFEIDPEEWILFDPYGLEEASELLDQHNYLEAKKMFENVLFVNAQEKTAIRMLKHINYMLQNNENNRIDIFNKYLGKYELNGNRYISLIKENDEIFLSSQRGKYKIYPISDTKFIIRELDMEYSINKDASGNNLLLFNYGKREIKAKRINN